MTRVDGGPRHGNSVPPGEGDMGAEIRGEREVPRAALVTGLKFRDKTLCKGGEDVITREF